MRVEIGKKVSEISPSFQAINLDFSVVLGKDWWKPTAIDTRFIKKNIADCEPIDFSNKNLISYTSELTPTVLRIGGSASDAVYYDMDERGKLPRGFKYLLTRKRIDEIHAFAKASGCELALTINSAKGPRKFFTWQPDNAEKLLSYCADKKIPVKYWLFGNEVNAYGLIYGFTWKVFAKHYARDYQLFTKLVRKYYPKSQTVACSSAVWPVIGESPRFAAKVLRNTKPEILSWHYYPQQSKRSPIATRRAHAENQFALDLFEEIEDHITHFEELRANVGCKMWLGETSHALCGGEPGVSNTFASSLWWMNQLCFLAQHNIDVVARQDLVGSDYGLLAEQSFEPRPDYWISWLWKQFVGKDVYSVSHENKGSLLKLYSFSNKKGKGKIIICINIDSKSREVELPKTFSHAYHVTSESEFGQLVFVNKKKMSFTKANKVTSPASVSCSTIINIEARSIVILHEQ